jgi:hypothetical protein
LVWYARNERRGVIAAEGFEYRFVAPFHSFHIPFLLLAPFLLQVPGAFCSSIHSSETGNGLRDLSRGGEKRHNALRLLHLTSRLPCRHLDGSGG